MTDLRAGLAELADDAPTPTGCPGLWERGVRRARRRTAATVAASVTCLAVLGFSGATVWRAAAPVEPAPADTEGRTVLPDRIFHPSPWLDTTGEAGPIGPLLAVRAAERKSWTGSSYDVVGVSAVTQEYRFLDLPDRAGFDHLEETDGALSPDGRHLAYWVTGGTTDEPASAGFAGDPVVGYAVYDTEADELVLREDFATPHGLAPELLAWADADTLALDFYEYDAPTGDGGTSSRGTAEGLRIRDLTAPASRPVPVSRTPWTLTSAGAGRLVFAGNRQMLVVDADDPTQRRRLTSEDPVDGRWFLAPDGRTVAVQPHALDERGTREVLVGTVPAGDRPLRLHPVPGFTLEEGVVGWVDAGHLLVTGHLEGVESITSGTVYATFDRLDVVTGEAETLVGVESGADQPQLALGLLDSPVVDAKAPASPTDPRVAAALGVAALLGVAGIVALVVRRRRVLP